MRQKWLSLLPICRLPKFDSTLEILFLTACAVFPPWPFLPIGPNNCRQGGPPICLGLADGEVLLGSNYLGGQLAGMAKEEKQHRQ